MKLKLKTTAIIFLIIGVLMIVVSFILPPTGVVDNSVLAAMGEIIGATGVLMAWHAIDKGIDAKFSHGSSSVELQNPDK